MGRPVVEGEEMLPADAGGAQHPVDPQLRVQVQQILLQRHDFFSLLIGRNTFSCTNDLLIGLTISLTVFFKGFFFNNYIS